MEGARNEWSMIVARGVVVVYFARLGGRLRNDQKIMLDADAQAMPSSRAMTSAAPPSRPRLFRPVFFVPDDTLLRDEASSLGIRRANDFYGGIVPHPCVKTKAITHQLIGRDAQRPQGWST